jgi:beta-mannosidase
MSGFRVASLSGAWQLAPVDRFADSYADLKFLQMEVPSHWQQLPDLRGHAGKVVYRKTFAWKPEKGRVARLVVPGIFYWSTVRLNGRTLGAHEGYFAPQVYVVTEILKSGENELLIEVDCPDEKEKLGKRMITGVFSHWDCLDPTTNPGGIWLAPEIRESGFAYISQNLIHTERIDDLGALQRERLIISSSSSDKARLRVIYAPENFNGEPVSFVEEITLGEGENKFDFRRTIKEPRLWWTHDLGDANLYRVTVNLETPEGKPIDEWSDIIGLRAVEFSDWVCHLNGRRLYIKGDNLAPVETRIATTAEDRCVRLLELAKGAHMNMLRVHAHVDHPVFYRAADRAGVLLWQDMPLQWAYVKEVLPEAVRQVRQMVRLLFNRPSVAVWCCHNEAHYVVNTKDEDFISVARTAFSSMVYSWNREVMDVEMKKAAQDTDPSRFVNHTSGQPAFVQKGTDFHFYGGWYRAMGTLRAFDKIVRISKKNLRFVTEFGAQSFPNLENAVKFMDADLSKIDWKHLEEEHSLQYELITHWTPMAGHKDLGDYIRATQDYQSHVNRHYIDRIRALKYKPNGGCVPFMFNDPNPAILWSLVDYWLAPKSSYFKMRDALRPLYAFVLVDKDLYRIGERIRIPLYVVSDLAVPLEKVRVEVVALDDEKRPLARKAYETDLPADSEAVKLGELEMRAYLTGKVSVTLKLTGWGEPFENHYVLRIS